MADQASEIRQALKGLRLVSISSGPEGFGFRMYTNRNVEVSGHVTDGDFLPHAGML